MPFLLHGVTGSGKTEIYLQVIAELLKEDKQIIVLVPEISLTPQIVGLFKKKFGNLVAVFHSHLGESERYQTWLDIKQEKVKIVIGARSAVFAPFANLGLIIIDEEQRFGVKAKEHLKTLKTGVDCITLSATPIPRTLYMSLVHTKDMSVINTPPQDRLPIQTVIAEMDDKLIQNALERELAREGQAYILHNRVESIHERKSHIQKLIPKASIGIA